MSRPSQNSHTSLNRGEDGAVLDPTAPAMGAKSLCTPFEQEPLPAGGLPCINPECKNTATQRTLFGRSY